MLIILSLDVAESPINQAFSNRSAVLTNYGTEEEKLNIHENSTVWMLVATHYHFAAISNLPRLTSASHQAMWTNPWTWIVWPATDQPVKITRYLYLCHSCCRFHGRETSDGDTMNWSFGLGLNYLLFILVNISEASLADWIVLTNIYWLTDWHLPGDFFSNSKIKYSSMCCKF